ncbi:MAG: hypothetical protein KGZ97_01345 [Bacteroidetes bacterium]|nr:hypothetical protein [Bacteroidota bacterium]
MKKNKTLFVSLFLMLSIFLLLGFSCTREDLIINNEQVLDDREPLNDNGEIIKEESQEEKKAEDKKNFILPAITFSVKTRGFNYVFNVFRDGEKIGEIKSPYEVNMYDELSGLNVLALDYNYVYFSDQHSSGLGGYGIGCSGRTVYQINLENNKINKFFEGHDPTFNLSLDKAIYFLRWNHLNEPTREMNLISLPDNNLIKKFNWPEPYFSAQTNSGVYNLKFSPKEDKIAFVAAMGPDDEQSSVFIFYLDDGKIELVDERKGDLFFKIRGWIDNETVDYE